MFFHLQPEIDLKAGSNGHINLIGYIEGMSIFVFQKHGFLSRNTHHNGVNTKQLDFAPRSADSSIKVTVLPLTFASMHFLHRANLQFTDKLFNCLQFLENIRFFFKNLWKTSVLFCGLDYW